MELIRISEEKLKIMLTASDMTAYELDPEALSGDTARCGQAFRLLLADVRRQIPFRTEDRQLTVQYFPSRGGGCEMFISSTPTGGTRKVAGALTVRGGQRSSAVFRWEGAYRFASLGVLLRACRRLCEAGYLGESAAYRDGRGGCYILLTALSPSPFAVPDSVLPITEYGDPISPARLRLLAREHLCPICTANAAATLGGLD